jgi:uncharacterized RDD family membrane protein YckC
MLSRLDPLLEEFIVAAVAMLTLGVIVALAFWGFTDISPWPLVILAEVGGFGFGTALLALGSPRRSR